MLGRGDVFVSLVRTVGGVNNGRGDTTRSSGLSGWVAIVAMLGLYIGIQDGNVRKRDHRLMGKDIQAPPLRRLQHDGMGMKATAFGGTTEERGNKAGVLAANRLICDSQYNLYIVHVLHPARFGHALPLKPHAHHKPMV